MTFRQQFCGVLHLWRVNFARGEVHNPLGFELATSGGKGDGLSFRPLRDPDWDAWISSSFTRFKRTCPSRFLISPNKFRIVPLKVAVPDDMKKKTVPQGNIYSEQSKKISTTFPIQPLRETDDAVPENVMGCVVVNTNVLHGAPDLQMPTSGRGVLNPCAKKNTTVETMNREIGKRKGKGGLLLR